MMIYDDSNNDFDRRLYECVIAGKIIKDCKEQLAITEVGV